MPVHNVLIPSFLTSALDRVEPSTLRFDRLIPNGHWKSLAFAGSQTSCRPTRSPSHCTDYAVPFNLGQAMKAETESRKSSTLSLT
jgi:hypothetical protein